VFDARRCLADSLMSMRHGVGEHAGSPLRNGYRWFPR